MGIKIIGGSFKGRLLKTPKGNQTRPTTGLVRGAVFNICQEQVAGARFLDLFAGSGAMGFEALSRGASFATFIEKDRQALRILKENASLLSVEPKIQIIGGPVIASLSRLATPYDIIYIDPPYGNSVNDVLQQISVQRLLNPTGFLFVEERENSQPLELKDSWVLLTTRSYGISQLHQFTLPL